MCAFMIWPWLQSWLKKDIGHWKLEINSTHNCVHFLKITCYWISRIGPNVFHFYWHNIHFKGRFFTNRWIVDCSWKPEQEVKWCFAPGREPQSIHSVNPSFSSAHDRTPGSNELQRDKRTNGRQTLLYQRREITWDWAVGLCKYFRMWENIISVLYTWCRCYFEDVCLLQWSIWRPVGINKEMCRWFIVKSTMCN